MDTPAWLTALFPPYDPAAEAALQAQMAQARTEAVAARTTQQAARRAARCPKCGGTGHLPQYQHRQQGMCYRCEGTGRAH